MSSKYLVVHYHRVNSDYYSWHLGVSPAPTSPPSVLYSQAVPHATTSYGALFRIQRSALPLCPYLLPCLPYQSIQERTSRRLTLSDEHVFLAEGSSVISNEPTIISPLVFLLSDPNPKVLRIYAGLHVIDVFPQSAKYRAKDAHQVFIVPHQILSNERSLKYFIYHYDHAPPAVPAPNSESIEIRSKPTSFLLSGTSSNASETVMDVAQLICEQASIFPALSRSSVLSRPLASHQQPSKLSRILTVYCHTFEDKKPTQLSAKFLSRHRPPPINAVEPYQRQTAFALDLSAIPDRALEKGLELCPESKAPKPLQWYPHMGYQIIHAESFNRLLTPNEVDLTLVYHRFDDVLSAADWEMHLWTEATDEYPAQSTMLTADTSGTSNVISFMVTGVIFPAGATVYAQPVRMDNFRRPDTMNELGEGIPGEAYRDACRRDVVRSWKSGGAPSSVLHFVQGDSTARIREPLPSEMSTSRYFVMRYRRFEPDDYEGWDLWTWDDADPKHHRVAVRASSVSRAWADYVLDRGAYGAGARISFMPRQGGDEWTARDEPFRVWDCELLESNSSASEVAIATEPTRSKENLDSNSKERMPAFITVEGSATIFQRLVDAKSHIRAYVDSDHSILVKTCVPVQWISPSRPGRAPAIARASVTVCHGYAECAIKDAAGLRSHFKRVLRFRKTKQVSPTLVQLLFEPEEVTFDEDYLVEKVVVSVPGFNDVALTWEVHDDWDKYLYPGTLGWQYDKSQTIFRCFSPTSDNVSVVLYGSATGKAGRTVVPMRRIPHGCWKAIVMKDLKGKYYKLLAEGENKRLFPGVEVIDPYSRCNTAHNGRGLIFGKEDTNIHPRPNIKPSEAIIYELHIRDLTIDETSGVKLKGKYLGVTERGTCMKNLVKDKKGEPLTPWEQEEICVLPSDHRKMNILSTGLDHIVQMGVNTIQILPIQDFDNDEENDEAYRWGYMPVHYNSPDGWYATSTKTATRVTEFKKLVDAAHKAGLKVVMDVVYNHTAEDSNEFNLDARFSFNGIAPRYYYRTCGNTPVAVNGSTTCAMRKPEDPRCGSCYSNGSGCGNEFRSEAPMGRKYIIDSLKYWANEYKVDGFRFDLLGLIDLETLRQATSELKGIDNNIMVYGEPWIGGLTPIKITDKGSQRSKGFAVFNDTFRDAIRGSSFHVEENFIMDGGRLTDVKGGVIGSIDVFCDSPLESINYVECHDNYTLWDQMRFYIKSRTDNITFTEHDMRRMSRLSALIVFTSQGIPFIQSGQEMCRTKFDVENSYESPDEINKIRWATKQKEWTTVLYYRGLILLRRSHPEIFCMESADLIHESIIFYEDLDISIPGRCIAYKITGNPQELLSRLNREFPNEEHAKHLESASKWAEVVILLNPTPSEVSLCLPGAEEGLMWIQIVDASSAGVRNLRGPLIGRVSVPGRSGAVLRRASEKEVEDFQLELRLGAVSEVYESFHGDNALSRYSVGLDVAPSAEESRNQEHLIALRKRFEDNRIMEERFNPLSYSNENEAIEGLNLRYRKQSRSAEQPKR